jgi:hypothetical protein
MKIHLAKPGGEREGPFTVEEINAGLAQNRFRGTDYWAWYEGLQSWVPLHEIPGINEDSAPPAKASEKATPDLAPAAADTSVIAKKAPAPESQKSSAATPAKSQLGSGLPAEALEQVFIFTDGEGPETMRSPFTSALLEQVIGVSLEAVRDHVTRSVFGKCNIALRLRQDSRVPGSAWEAISAINADLVKQTHEGAYKVCVRTFDTDTGQKVAAFLFYNKGKVK